MRKPRRFLLIALLIIAALGAVAWFLLRPDPEPTYQGMPLTYWLDGLVLGNPSPDKATEAVRQIGTNAIPTLLRMLRADDSKFKLKLIQLSQKQHLINLKWRTAQIENYEANIGFMSLGSQARSAAPALIQIYNERHPGLDNNPEDIIQLFIFLGPAAADAVPLLVQASTNTNPTVRLKAVVALGNIRAQPNLSVPVLITSLHDPDNNVREGAATSLAAFGSDAKSAVPDLVKALADPSLDVRHEAASALQKIDPEAAAKAGVK